MHKAMYLKIAVAIKNKFNKFHNIFVCVIKLRLIYVINTQ
ncbi:hypothetical protein P20480_1954 [Pseudoalteromonas sp. BSi20480]|nr:hypothetical protein P20480_1954 [Pseudoalteromonas sp. BSi20480]